MAMGTTAVAVNESCFCYEFECEHCRHNVLWFMGNCINQIGRDMMEESFLPLPDKTKIKKLKAERARALINYKYHVAKGKML